MLRVGGGEQRSSYTKYSGPPLRMLRIPSFGSEAQPSGFVARDQGAPAAAVQEADPEARSMSRRRLMEQEEHTPREIMSDEKPPDAFDAKLTQVNRFLNCLFCQTTQAKLKKKMWMKLREQILQMRADPQNHAQEVSAMHDNFGVLSNLMIARDGGLTRSEVRKLTEGSKIWIKVFYALLNSGFVIYNFLFISVQDFKTIFNSQVRCTAPAINERRSVVFRIASLVLEYIVNAALRLTGNSESCPHFWFHNDLYVIALVELLCLSCIIIQLAYCVMLIAFSQEAWQRWTSTAEFWWQVLPVLQWFTAMRLLFYSTATHIGMTICIKWQKVMELAAQGKWMQAALPFLAYLLFIVFCLVVGIEAFVVRMSLAYKALVEGEIIRVLLFIVQVMHIYAASVHVRERLFLFIFGGEDGILTLEEAATREVWEGMLAKQMWQATYPNLLMYLILLISYDDYDFQLLILDEKQAHESGMKKANVLKGIETIETSDLDGESDYDDDD